MRRLLLRAAQSAYVARLELRLNLRGPAPWVTGGILALLGYLAARTSPDNTSFPVAWALWEDLSPLAGGLLLFLAAGLAHRPVRYETLELEDSRPVSAGDLLVARWIAAIPATWLALGFEFAGAALAQALHTRHPIRWEAYGYFLVQGLPVATFLASLAFLLVGLLRHLIAGAGAAALVWVTLHLGRDLVPTSLALNLSQNGLLFLGLTGGLILLGGRAAGTRLTRGLARRLSPAGVALLIACCLRLAWQERALPGRARALTDWKRHAPGRPDRDRPLPAFSWVDSGGRRFSLATLRSAPSLLVFLQPDDPGLAGVLVRLAAVSREFREDDLQVVSVLLTEDLGAARALDRLLNPAVRLTVDWGKPGPSEFDRRRPGSVAAWKLGVSRTPFSLLLDAGGRERRRELPLDEASFDELRLQVREALRS